MYNAIPFGHENNGILSFAPRQVNLEDAVLSEINIALKDKY